MIIPILSILAANKFKIPIATTHIVVCTIFGIGLGFNTLNIEKMIEIVAWWIATPIAIWLLNYLIGKSTGSYIARQDADDISELDRIEKQIKFIDTTSVDGCTTRAFIMKENKITPNKSIYFPKKIVMRFKNPFIHGTLLIKKEQLIEVGGYNENFYYAQDYKLMTDLISKNKRFRIIKEPLYFLNMKGNISEIYKKEQKYYSDCVKKGLNPINE